MKKKFYKFLKNLHIFDYLGNELKAAILAISHCYQLRCYDKK